MHLKKPPLFQYTSVHRNEIKEGLVEAYAWFLKITLIRDIGVCMCCIPLVIWTWFTNFAAFQF